MSKRLAVLENMIQKGSKDPFAWYALAMEYAGADRIDDALRTFTSLRDMETCYKMIRTGVAQALPLAADRFDIEPEITARLLAGGYRICEVPVRYAPRHVRKLNPWRDGPHALWTLLRLRYRS